MCGAARSRAWREWKWNPMSERSPAAVDVAVIGAGPAGMAAAAVAAEEGRSVLLLDDNPSPGGQIWRGESAATNSPAARWLNRLDRSGARSVGGASVFHIQEGRLAAEHNERVLEIAFSKLILGTGARERFLPFPGWTLPGVLGAGALQALIKSGLPVAGKRIVVAGTGPLLLAVAAYAREKGATIACIAEQASRASFLRFGFGALLSGSRSAAAVGLLRRLWGVPCWTDCWPAAALGQGSVKAVRLIRGGVQIELPCDYLACGFHLVPSTELAQLAGCRLEQGLVAVDSRQETSVAGVFCAGESTGIGGFERALLEGQIAGYASTGQARKALRLAGRRAAAERHVRSIRNAFALRGELRSLPEDDTVLCRCEDVRFGQLRGLRSWRAAKLETRCGMGPCQGRVCGPATEFLFGWEVTRARSPVFPVSCSSLARLECEPTPGGLP
jgi:NADPH-dependent 2,4-dienoyl-CoA reductase/sulfur reductase-like enzyme